MTPELRLKLAAVAGALEPLVWMLADAETHALPTSREIENIKRARVLFSKVQAWARAVSVTKPELRQPGS